MATKTLDSFTESTLFTYLVAVFVLLGLFASCRTLYRVFYGIWIYFLRPGKNLRKYGSWAIVTGCTDGIGRCYAEALAKKGLHLVLVSRMQSRLTETADAISASSRVKTTTVQLDFAKANNSDWARLAQAIEGLDIGILVNNAGMSYDHAEFYEKLDSQLAADIVSVNITGTNMVTKITLPGMLARKRGAIVNIGSAAATVAPSGPLYAVYAASKAYIDMFSRSLDLEYSHISVHNQAPAYVATKMSKIRRPTLDAPSPKRWVAAAINHIGYEVTQCPYWFHGLMWGVASSLPTWVVDAIITRQHLDFRRRYYRKLERAAVSTKQQ